MGQLHEQMRELLKFNRFVSGLSDPYSNLKQK